MNTMESVLLFEKMLSSADLTPPSLCSPTEDPFEDSFTNEIYMKFVDDTGDLDLFSEIDRNHAKMVTDNDFQLINDKVDLPIEDLVLVNEGIDLNGFDSLAGTKNEQLMMEFNSILDAVSNSSLTPPQTPPPEIFQIHEVLSPEYQQQLNIPDSHYEIYDYQQPAEIVKTLPVPEQFIFVQNNASPSNFYEESNQEDEIIFDPESIISSPADIQRELEVVDELVRAHSRNNSDIDENTSQFSYFSSWSPRSEFSSGSSCSSHYDDCESKSRKSGLKGVSKKRSRAYGRNPEEKKHRKKEQNKNAATRYRQKKKVEIEVILDEEKILADKNRKLMGIYKETRREVKYLKSLLRDLFKARGFIQ